MRRITFHICNIKTSLAETCDGEEVDNPLPLGGDAAADSPARAATVTTKDAPR